MRATAIVLLACTPAHGTLALLLPTKEGIVACADRREWNRAEGPKDTDKIFALNRRAAFIVVGVARLSVTTLSALVPVYSLSDSVQRFYTRRQFVNRDSEWRKLASVLKLDFEDAYRKHNATIEVSPGATDDVVWEIDFLYATNRTPAVKQILYHRGGETTLNSLPEKPYITGQTEVSLRILRPQQYADARFSDLSGNVRIARALNFSASGYPGGVAVEDALVLAHTFIRASAERMRFVANEPDLVGPICDCGIMRGSGFEWLQRAIDTRTAGFSLPH